MSEKTLSRAERDLLLYFLDQLSDKMGSAGCNDMDQRIINAMDPVDRLNIYGDFLEYDSKANPTGWEPREIDGIPDFSWVGYLKSKVKELL